MPRSGRDEDRIARADHSTFAIEFYLARAFEDEIKLLRDLVIVPLCPASCGDARFRKALVLDGRIRAIENRTDSRAVFRDKRRLGREILDGHSFNNQAVTDAKQRPGFQSRNAGIEEGTAEIEGKAARVAATELGRRQRVSIVGKESAQDEQR